MINLLRVSRSPMPIFSASLKTMKCLRPVASVIPFLTGVPMCDRLERVADRLASLLLSMEQTAKSIEIASVNLRQSAELYDRAVGNAVSPALADANCADIRSRALDRLAQSGYSSQVDKIAKESLLAL